MTMLTQLDIGIALVVVLLGVRLSAWTQLTVSGA
jgi:hypothetical protein